MVAFEQPDGLEMRLAINQFVLDSAIAALAGLQAVLFGEMIEACRLVAASTWK